VRQVARAHGKQSVQGDSREGIHSAVGEAWIEILESDGRRVRHALKGGLTTFGGKRGDIPLAATGNDQLHFWDQPPKLVFVGADEAPRVNGERCDERALRPGDRIEWRGVTLNYGGPSSEPRSTPSAAPLAVAVAPLNPSAALDPGEGLLWQRLKAGMFVELGLADAAVVKRWRDASQRREFDPDACARDVLATTHISGTDARLIERTARLEQELVSASSKPKMRLPLRRKGSSGPSGFAIFLGQIILIAVIGGFVLTGLFIAHWRFHWSVDLWFDQLGERFTAWTQKQ
jgi:hypothetical protein